VTRHLSLAIVTAALVAVTASVAASPAAGAVQLTSPGARSHWAFVVRPVTARAKPRSTAGRVTRLRTRTYEGTHELVVALERTLDRRGRSWVRVRLPILPNNSTGWVPRTALGALYRVDTHLVVNRRTLTAQLRRRGRTIFRTRVGVGQRRWPTPAGEFYVRNQLRGFANPVYGPIAFGTSARSTVLTDWPGGGFIGIHGTNAPELLPGRVSHGCIRMSNRAIRRLARLMPVGTPLTIR
jgi:lipoprotein-anchoring transpeptidase ErfK/SrfK